jgi:pyridoxamine 5'-phosphate oxidase
VGFFSDYLALYVINANLIYIEFPMNDFLNATNPFALFTEWLNEACATSDIKEPTAMSLATAKDNIPSNRMVLLKAHDARGFVFYTNLDSRKSGELHANAHAALCFYWAALDKQVRVVGRVETVSDAEADAYFASRSRGKQLGAWASEQSRPLPHPDALAQRISELEREFEGKSIPRPPHWSGWRVVPHEIEFWQQKEFRLHERIRFTLSGKTWQGAVLYP